MGALAGFEWLSREHMNVKRAAVTQYGGKVERAEAASLVLTGGLCNLASL